MLFRSTPESKFVHDVDKVELLLQMVEYERTSKCTLDLSEFSWVATRVELPEMKKWAQEILQERAQLWVDYEKTPREPIKAEVIKQGHDEYYGSNGSAHAANDGANGRTE